MQETRMHIEKNTTQETLVIPLYARKLCTELYPSLYQDPGATALIEGLDYDFSALEKQSKKLLQRFGALEIAMRQTDLATEVRDYLREHPHAAVVNLGCGLDQTGEVSGAEKVYNLDMPDVIAIRNQLLPPGEGVKNISCDLNDLRWADSIDGSGGAVFFASGVFYYFTVEQVRSLVNGLAERFPGGKLVFDTANEKALKMMLKTFVRQAGIRNIRAYFHVQSLEEDVTPWLKKARASSRGYMLGYSDLRDPCVPGPFRWLAKFGDRYMNMMILRIDFDKE